MAHQDKLRSTLIGGTKVGFFDGSTIVEIRVYDHTAKGEWDRRIREEKEWNDKGLDYTTRYVNN